MQSTRKAKPDLPQGESGLCCRPGRIGWHLNADCITLKGTTLDRKAFEKMKDDYYRQRGWDVKTGLQTDKNLQKQGLGFVCEALDASGCLARE